MIGLDTNVLVRLFAEDDHKQRDAARALLDGLAANDKAVVNSVVVVELIWTLRRIYRFEREEISAVLRRLTEHPKILLPDRDIIRDAAHRNREIGGEVADHMIALINRSLGCNTTYTFDEDAADSPDFALLPT